MFRLYVFTALCAATLLAGCGDEHDDAPTDPHAALAEDACRHAEEAPVTVQAAADPAEAATAASSTHQAYAVQLPETDGQHGGAVLFTPTEAGEYAFFTGADVPFAIFDGAAEVAIEASEPMDACPGVLSTMHLVELELGTQYTLVLGPAANAEVTLLAVHVGDEDHASHDH